jgi:penicillin-binding protein 1A
MADLGFITRTQCKTAQARPIKVIPERRRSTGYLKAQYFAQYVVEQLRDQLHYDEDVLNKAGLEVVTTLDWDMQKAAEKAAREGVARYRRANRVSEAALVCLDPNTGYIRAMVGGVNKPWEKYQFNCATQARRQPGSSFKLFVYAAAMEAGDGPYTGVAAVVNPIRVGDKIYAPKNHGRFNGYTNYRNAFAMSLNGAAVNVAVKRGVYAGPRKIKELAQRLGLKGDIQAYPSLALGTSEATVLEMASAYGVFAAGGRRAEPLAILQIRDSRGTVIRDFNPKVENTGLSQHTLAGMNELTRAVVTGGTATVAGQVPNAHGKTGTSEDYTDAWFCGYTPELVTAVWAGNRDNSKMRHLYGGTISAPIWTEFMQQAVKLNPAKKKKPTAPPVSQAKAKTRPRRERRPRPVAAPVADEGNGSNRVRVTVCPDSGMLAGPNCPSRVRQEYLIGDQPMDVCPIHTGEKKRDPEEPDKPAAETAAAGTERREE